MNRREAVRSLAGGSALGLLAGALVSIPSCTFAPALAATPIGTDTAATMAALVERNRAYLAAYCAADFEAGGREAEKAFLATADTEAGDILYQDPPPVRSHADLMAALQHVADDSDFIDKGHERILRQALRFLAARA